MQIVIYFIQLVFLGAWTANMAVCFKSHMFLLLSSSFFNLPPPRKPFPYC